MFKQLIIFFLLLSQFMNPHGFGGHTFISLADNYYQAIDNLCITYRIKKSKCAVLSYKEKTKKYTTQKIKSIATGKANCYFAIAFDSFSAKPDVTCTPDQEFYLIKKINGFLLKN